MTAGPGAWAPPAIPAAPGPRRGARLLVVDPTADRFAVADVADLPALLAPGDLVVLNDAGTFPASLRGEANGAPVELRLLALPDADGRARAVRFGAGDWRTPTERRPAPPAGGRLRFGALHATVEATDPRSDRLVTVRFDRAGPALVRALWALGRPVQYSYLAADVPLGAVQTPFAGPPVSAEMPSAGRALTPRVLAALRARGVALATLTHAAGLSATGDDALDARLPFPERYALPEGTVAAVAAARARGGRVVAIGTTVARALEGAALAGAGRLRPGPGETHLVLDAGTPLRVVDGLLSGVHVPGESHYRVLQAAAPEPLLRRAVAQAAAAGFLAHEFGDGTLVLPGSAEATR